ncbi:MAG TPA: hypothetical protein DCG42_13285 [Maribacter sp.]|uniref:hypothetical protein n=1 Tax=unclassified Maribacter TaxID=2615042 RepID=UPI000EC86F76|nr:MULTISPECIES: hypothetical protein [unclassified Maribacter]HAF78282.1 hypothetical protein [Maribacter sp.]|tara:strand:- start:334 stop:1086 length:753 start_codon:yes stop_codon:yes gene_type:complete
MVLFRKVRSRLIKLEKFKTYLIYALGEILLIVIGLLIAWKINDINESRKNRIVEVKIYKSLSQELNTNLGVLDSAIADYTKNIQTLQNTINYLGMEPAELTADAKSMIVNLNYQKTIVRDEAINSINATNKFEFIESDSLKKLIAAYPNELDNFNNQQIKIENIINERLKPIIEKHISLIEILPEDSYNYQRMKNYGNRSNYPDLLVSREYQNSVIDRLLQTKGQLSIAKNLRNKTKIIATKLNQELNRS